MIFFLGGMNPYTTRKKNFTEVHTSYVCMYFYCTYVKYIYMMYVADHLTVFDTGTLACALPV